MTVGSTAFLGFFHSLFVGQASAALGGRRGVRSGGWPWVTPTEVNRWSGVR
ncbi:hypothetical protein [Mycolicibacterium fortuitum]|uniref:hypothetical protein n=1 Tax=Mycolicibacterium fortuitum TaxID=1766 RepID=UPI001CE06A15|nr:hypothetical protein [Mycolicibacterium fortuitum]MCA4726574.1 hypothetical protein [Mycolicibacterium fortuitum]